LTDTANDADNAYDYEEDNVQVAASDANVVDANNDANNNVAEAETANAHAPVIANQLFCSLTVPLLFTDGVTDNASNAYDDDNNIAVAACAANGVDATINAASVYTDSNVDVAVSCLPTLFCFFLSSFTSFHLYKEHHSISCSNLESMI